MQNFYFVFGLITLAAAIQGAIAGSKISLIAGGVLGGLVLAGGCLYGSTLALILALIGSLGIAGKFMPDFLKKGKKIWPAGTLGLLGVVSLVLTVLTFVRR